jgi:uncharacterized protein YjbI with pentapeptide repeats
MKKIVVPALVLLVILPPVLGQAATPMNPLEIPKYVREWFSGQDFTGKPKVSGHYRQSRMNGTSFQGVKFTDATFEQCDLAGTNMKGAVFGAGTKFYLCTLNGADLRGADFSGATIDSVNFRGADLRKAKGFRNLRKVNFQRADLRGADFSKMRQPLVDIDWTDAIYDSTTKFPAGLNPASVGAKVAK